MHTPPPAPTPIAATNDEPLNEDLPCDACGYNLRTRRPSQDCPECGAGVRGSIEEWERKRLAGPLTLEGFGKSMRSIYVLLGVLLPIAPFLLMEGGTRVEWQSGEWKDYVGMLLGGVASRPFYPFLLFAGAAMIALVSQPIVMGRRMWVRVGLLVGVVIGAQYTLILCASVGAEVAMIGLFAVGVSLLMGLFFLKFPRNWIEWLRQSLVTPVRQWIPSRWVIVLILVIVGAFGIISGVFVLAIMFGLLFSPWLYLTIYTLACARVLRSVRLPGQEDNADARWPWYLGGLTGYFLAWGGSVALAMQAYAKLPTQPPQTCYVCTAAANGHAKLVGSEPVTLASGETIRVNRQMRILKAAELALLATTPKGHRACRAAYDRIGPVLARRITSPVVADMVYLSLTPIAWVLEKALRRSVPGFNSKADHLYRATPKR